MALPESTRPGHASPAKFGVDNQTWNDGSGRFNSCKKNVPDVEFINAMIDDVGAAHPVDARRIYAEGFSNGASMNGRLGVELSARLAAIAAVAGTLCSEDQALAHPVSLLYISGDADPLNPINGGIPKLAKGSTFKGGGSERPTPRPSKK